MDNPWTGYISYGYKKNKETTGDSYAVEGTATNTITTSYSHNITVQIGWNEEPNATFNIRESVRSHIIGKYKMNCGKKGGKSGTWDIREDMENLANEKVRATVSVSIAISPDSFLERQYRNSR